MSTNHLALSYNWCNSIEEINKEDWDRIFQKNMLKSFAFFKAQYNAEIEGASFMFLVVKSNDITLAIVPCFTYRLKLDVIASPLIRRISEVVKKRFSNFLSVRIFGVGSLASTCEQHIGIADGLDKDTYRSVSEVISEQIKKKSKELKIKLVFVKEVPESQLSEIKRILSKDYYFYDSLPTNIVPLFPEILPYPSGLRRKERYRYRDLKSKFEKKYHWEKVIDFSQLTKEFEQCYLATLFKSPSQFEIMNEAFFKNINESFKDNSYLLIAKDKQGITHSMGLIIEEENALIPIYLGLNYENSEKELKLLHINSMYRVIEEAEKDNKQLVMLGQTSYYSKALCGALVQRLYLGFYSYNTIIQYCIRHFFGKLFTPATLTPNTYRAEVEKSIKDKMKYYNYMVDN